MDCEYLLLCDIGQEYVDRFYNKHKRIPRYYPTGIDQDKNGNCYRTWARCYNRVV